MQKKFLRISALTLGLGLSILGTTTPIQAGGTHDTCELPPGPWREKCSSRLAKKEDLGNGRCRLKTVCQGQQAHAGAPDWSRITMEYDNNSPLMYDFQNGQIVKLSVQPTQGVYEKNQSQTSTAPSVQPTQANNRDAMTGRCRKVIYKEKLLLNVQNQCQVTDIQGIPGYQRDISCQIFATCSRNEGGPKNVSSIYTFKIEQPPKEIGVNAQGELHHTKLD